MVVHVIFPDSMQKPTGGLGEQFRHLYSRLKHKIEYHIMGYPEEKLIENYYPVHNDMPSVEHSSLGSILNYNAWAYASIKCKSKPDLIHAYDWSTFFPSYYAAKYWEVPLLCSMQLSVKGLRQAGVTYCGNYDSIDGFWIHKAHEEVELFGLQQANKIIHVSNNYSKRFEEFKDKSVIIPNGIDLNFFKKPHNPYPFPGNGSKKLVYIGRFAEMKNILTLCNCEIPPEIDLYFVGDSRGGEEYCWNAIQNKCLEPNVHYLGFLQDQDKLDLLKSADGVILPSLHEPFGIVGLEALASDCILLSSFVDGIADYLTEDVGLNCGTDIYSISNSLHDFLNLPIEEIKIRNKKGQKIVKKYDWDKLSNQYYNVYKDLLITTK